MIEYAEVCAILCGRMPRGIRRRTQFRGCSIMRMSFLRRSRCAGFSLMEVAIGMTVLGLMMAGFLAGYRVYQKTKADNVTAKHIEIIEEAVGTFYFDEQRYPKPMPFKILSDDTNYGREGSSISSCSSAPPIDLRVCRESGPGGNVLLGNVPFMDLNIAEEVIYDGWGNRFTFAVSEPLVTGVPTNTICVNIQSLDGDNYNIFNCNASDGHLGTTIPYEDIAIISHGQDGFGAWGSRGKIRTACNTAIPNSGGTSGVQEENCDYDGTFVRPREVTNLLQDTLNVSGTTIDVERATRFMGTRQGFAERYNDDVVSIDIKVDQNFWSENTGVVKNKSDMKIGIGTADPIHDVDVNGGIRATNAEAAKLCKNPDGTNVRCFEPKHIAGTGIACNEESYMSGIANADTYCEPAAPEFSCASGYAIVGIDADGRPMCQNHSNPTECVPVTQTRNVECPSGQIGNIVETRSKTCPGGTWSAWAAVTNSCVVKVPDCPVMPGPSYGTCVSNDDGKWLCCELDECKVHDCAASYP